MNGWLRPYAFSKQQPAADQAATTDYKQGGRGWPSARFSIGRQHRHEAPKEPHARGAAHAPVAAVDVVEASRDREPRDAARCEPRALQTQAWCIIRKQVSKRVVGPPCSFHRPYKRQLSAICSDRQVACLSRAPFPLVPPDHEASHAYQNEAQYTQKRSMSNRHHGGAYDRDDRSHCDSRCWLQIAPATAHRVAGRIDTRDTQHRRRKNLGR